MAHDYSKEISSAPIAPSELDLEADAIKFAFKAANVGYWVWNIQTGHIYLSDVSLKMLQMSKTEFGHNIKDIKDLIHPEDYDDLKRSLAKHIEDKTFFEIEFRARRQDMSYIWINIDGRAADDDANTLCRVGGSVVDASAYVDLKEQLAREKRNLRLIFDNVPTRIWLKDAHNKIIRLNKTAAESMNLSVEEIEGSSTYDLFPELAKAYHEADLAVINSGQPLEGIIEEYVPKDGQRGWVRTDKLPFTHPETNEKHILVLATDITQQKEYENEILQNSIRLNQANKDLDQFTYMASHDLKSPLRGMDDLTQWIEEDLGEAITSDIKNKLDLLRGRVNRMETLLKDILAFSRAGKNMADPENVDIGSLVDEVIDWLSPLGAFKIIRDTDLPTLCLPKSAIQHIILNLISNAIKHHDQADAIINIGCKENDKYHIFYVTDNGPGIPKQFQDHVFEIFKTLKPRDAVEGSGIGLSIVKKMTEALGGQIEILSYEGQRGTTFNIYLPKD